MPVWHCNHPSPPCVPRNQLDAVPLDTLWANGTLVSPADRLSHERAPPLNSSEVSSVYKPLIVKPRLRQALYLWIAERWHIVFKRVFLVSCSDLSATIRNIFFQGQVQLFDVWGMSLFWSSQQTTFVIKTLKVELHYPQSCRKWSNQSEKQRKSN